MFIREWQYPYSNTYQQTKSWHWNTDVHFPSPLNFNSKILFDTHLRFGTQKPKSENTIHAGSSYQAAEQNPLHLPLPWLARHWWTSLVCTAGGPRGAWVGSETSEHWKKGEKSSVCGHWAREDYTSSHGEKMINREITSRIGQSGMGNVLLKWT